MEFQPDGIVHLELVLPDGTHELYTWNKVHLNTYFVINICLFRGATIGRALGHVPHHFFVV